MKRSSMSKLLCTWRLLPRIIIEAFRGLLAPILPPFPPIRTRTQSPNSKSQAPAPTHLAQTFYQGDHGSANGRSWRGGNGECFGHCAFGLQYFEATRILIVCSCIDIQFCYLRVDCVWKLATKYVKMFKVSCFELACKSCLDIYIEVQLDYRCHDALEQRYGLFWASRPSVSDCTPLFTYKLFADGSTSNSTIGRQRSKCIWREEAHGCRVPHCRGGMWTVYLFHCIICQCRCVLQPKKPWPKSKEFLKQKQKSFKLKRESLSPWGLWQLVALPSQSFALMLALRPLKSVNSEKTLFIWVRDQRI